VPFNKTLAYQSVATADLQRQLSVSSQGVELLLAEQQLCGFPDHAQDVMRGKQADERQLALLSRIAWLE